MNHSEDNFMRLEKKATNKVGLTILFIVVLLLLGVGGYFVYKNKDNISFDFTVPWKSKKDDQNDDETPNSSKTDEQTKLSRQKVTISSKKIYERNHLTVNPVSITYDEKNGYTVKISALYDSYNNLNIDISHITVDGYQLDTNINRLSLSPQVSQEITINVPISFLDLYNLEAISQVILYGKVEQINQNNNNLKLIVSSDKTSESTTALEDLEPISTNNDVKIYFYKLTTNQDNNLLQLLIANENDSTNYDLKINQLKINNTKCEDISFSESISYNSKKLVTLTIPTKKFRKIEDFDVSFFVINKDNLYLTKSSNIKIKK